MPFGLWEIVKGIAPCFLTPYRPDNKLINQESYKLALPGPAIKHMPVQCICKNDLMI